MGVQVVGVELSEGKKTRRRDLMFEAICDCLGWDWHLISKDQQGMVAQVKGILTRAGYTPEDVQAFREHWWKNDYRAIRYGRYPTIKVLRAEIGQVKQRLERDRVEESFV